MEKNNKIICDICKKDVKEAEESHTTDEMTMKARFYTCYDEYATWIDEYEINICSDCFMNKLKPLIEKTYNIEFREKNIG